MLKGNMSAEQLLASVFSKMTLPQLIETRKNALQQIAVLDQLIADCSSSEEVTPDA